jgi:uncharacterized RDD family membrane protein YckC
MEESLAAFREKLASYGDEDILSILGSLDRERFPDRYQAALAEARKRKASGNPAIAAPDPALKYRTLWRRVGSGLIDGALLLSASLYHGLKAAADSANGLWGLAEIVTALFNPKRRAVHDFLADTVCIRV